MNNQESPRHIAQLAGRGDLDGDQAEVLFRQRHEGEPRETAIVPRAKPFTEEDLRTAFGNMPLVEYGQFVAHKDEWQFLKRKEIAQTMRHISGSFTYGIVGIIDGVVDGLAYGVGELTENTTFLLTRTVKRAKDGVQRGLQDEKREKDEYY